MQKVSKLEKYKLSAPKHFNKMKATEDSVELHNIKTFPIRNTEISYDECPKYPSEPIKVEDLIIDQQIGSGTFGKVYSGRLKSNGAKIAVKRVQQDKKYKTR